MNVKTRAAFVARIFDTLAWVVLVLGALVTLFTIFGIFTEGVEYLLIALIVVVYTAISWASVSLASIVAGYIAQRADH
jgi:purine-cytosine permease-like protein